MANEIVIADLDNTIAMDQGRAKECLHSGERNWDTYYDRCGEDKPNDKIIALLDELPAEVVIWILSGRIQRTREVTVNWLKTHGVRYDMLVMRADDDRMQDSELKLKWATEFGFTPESVWFILEDRDRVVEAWRAAGYLCLQVAKGDY